MSKIPSPLLEIEDLARCLGCCIFSCSEEIVYSFFNILFGIFWDIKIWHMFHNLEKRIWFTTIFSPLKNTLTLFQIWNFFFMSLLILSHLELSRTELQKLTKYFNGNCYGSSCSGSSILFWYAQAHKDLASWKNYLRATLSLS